MTIRFGQFGKTTKQAVTTTAASWVDPAQPSTATGFRPSWRGKYLISSDQPVHIETHGSAAPTTSHRIPAQTIVEIETQLGESISFVLAADASGNGSIWITKTA